MKKFKKVEKTGFFRANTQISNLNVLHKGLLLQDWVFRLGSHLKALNFFMGSNPQIISIKDSTDMVNHFDTPLFVTVTTSKVHIF